MRSTKELLEVLLLEYENHKDDTVRSKGLCDAIERLTESHGVFTKDEKDRLMSFIYEHRPDLNAGEDDFWWEMGAIYPRIKFLQKLISRL